MFCILNIEYRTKNFEQQKFLKELVNILQFDILRFKTNDFQSYRKLPVLAGGWFNSSAPINE